MDEKNATRVFDLRTESEADSSGDATPPLYLIVVSGGIPGAMLRLAAGGTRIGRAADNTYPLAELCVSRYHAVLRAAPGGKVWLTDLASTNGTFLNGRRLPCHTPARVRDGDRIQFGTTVMVKFVRLDPSDEQFQREMFERTVRDSLTGLYNRSFFLSQVGSLAEFGAQKGLGLAILMLDVDHFKRINDAHGHDAGDAVLREVAEVLRQSTRDEDLVARYGGEEFVIALPAASHDQAIDRAERIRKNLASRRIVADGASTRVTASLGLTFSSPGRTRAVGELISEADRCLYRAKAAGRNRVVSEEDTDSHCGKAAVDLALATLHGPA